MRNPEPSDLEKLQKSIRLAWLKACQHDGIAPEEKFVSFSPDNPHLDTLNRLNKMLMYTMQRMGYFGGKQNPMLPQPPRMNPGSGLYQRFHEANPARTRRVQLPAPQGSLIAIGRAVKIEYEPYGNSKHKGTRFFHVFGDTGNANMKSNTLVCTDETGKNIFLIKDNPEVKRPYFTERGIIG